MTKHTKVTTTKDLITEYPNPSKYKPTTTQPMQHTPRAVRELPLSSLQDRVQLQDLQSLTAGKVYVTEFLAGCHTSVKHLVTAPPQNHVSGLCSASEKHGDHSSNLFLDVICVLMSLLFATYPYHVMSYARSISLLAGTTVIQDQNRPSLVQSRQKGQNKQKHPPS